MEHEGDGNTNSNWCAGNYSQSIGKGAVRPANERTSGYHLALFGSARILRRILEI